MSLIDKRIFVKGFGSKAATIRYVGEVDGHEGLWYGIEWDDCHLGKHNGLLGGRRYFQVASATGASFIRPHLAKLGISLEQAIEEKYVSNKTEAVHVQSNLFDILHLKELSERISDRTKLTDIAFEKWPVSFVANPLESAKQLYNLKSINLFGCLFSDIRDLLSFLSLLPCLESLTLSANRLTIACIETTPNNSARELFIDSTNLNWSSAMVIAKHFPRLEILSFANNGISTIGSCVAIEHVTQLLLPENNITEWSEVENLNQLSHLTVLSLSKNPIKEIKPSDHCLPALEQLHLRECPLKDWAQVAALNKLPRLKQLILHVPHLDGSEFVNAIGRLPSLKHFNGMSIGERERTEFELQFLKQSGEDADVKRLQDKYQLPGTAIKPTKNFIRLNVRLGDQFNFSRSVTVQVPRSMTAARLKSLLQKRLFSDKRHQAFELWQVVKHNEAPLDHMDKALFAYSLDDDDVLIIKMPKEA